MERETELEERQRHDREIAEENRARQVRQGVIPEDKSFETDSQPEPGVVDKLENQENEGAEEAERQRREEEERQLTEQQPQQYQGGEIPRQEPE